MLLLVVFEVNPTHSKVKTNRISERVKRFSFFEREKMVKQDPSQRSMPQGGRVSKGMHGLRKMGNRLTTIRMVNTSNNPEDRVC